MNRYKAAQAIKDAFFEGYKIRYKTYSEEGAEVAWRCSSSYVVYSYYLGESINAEIAAGW